jgi:hypothetical protein
MRYGDLVRLAPDRPREVAIIWPTPRRTFYSIPDEIIGYMYLTDLAVVLEEVVSAATGYNNNIFPKQKNTSFSKLILCNGKIGWIEKDELVIV